MRVSYWLGSEGKSITCANCYRTSYNQRDVEERYCGWCHQFHERSEEEGRMRRIDDKFHLEGEQIIKTSNGEAVPEDEPLFLLRGRDRLAVWVLTHYLKLSAEDGCTDYQLEGVMAALRRFQRFAQDHPERMKQPGITEGK